MHKFFLAAATLLGLTTSDLSAEAQSSFGVVNFTTCVTESKVGKKEQENVDNMRQQISSMIEGTEKELREIATKFDDSEYLDSLSPKAEEELKSRFQNLQEELSRYQNQFYQVLQHANYQLVNKMTSAIAKASEKIAATKDLDYVINKEACFYIRPGLDVTTLIINEMDKNFELEAKKLSENSDATVQKAG